MNPLYASIAMNLVELAGLGHIVKTVVGRARDSLYRLHMEGKLQRFNMLFLDHPENLYVPDFRKCESLGFVEPGSVIVADNILSRSHLEHQYIEILSVPIVEWRVGGCEG